MEGLIKGLMDVALGGDNKDHEPRDENRNHESRDERSRSTWAEVVSGEDDQDQDLDGDRSRRNRQEQNQDSDDQWEGERSKPSRRPQKAVHEEIEVDKKDSNGQNRWHRKDHEEESNDGWTTVGKKSTRRPQKVCMDNWNGYKRSPSEQDYSEDVELGASLLPSEVELGDLSNACYKLWELDLNRLITGKDYEIDIGEGKKVYQKEDLAQRSLFSWLSKDVLKRPTFSRFCSLLDNYNPNEGAKEVVTSEERQEQGAFIEEISRTAPIKYLHKYLAFKGMVSENYQDFKRTMTSLWFDLYRRGGTSGSSSAFEHVFVGEIKREGDVSGFHNWLQFYLEEAKGRVDYQGFILPRHRGEIPDSETQLLTIQFEWNGVLKSVSSTLVGVSPEFEIALYTLCFYVGGEDNHVQLGPYPVNIKCYRFGERMGSVFPVAES